MRDLIEDYFIEGNGYYDCDDPIGASVIDAITLPCFEETMMAIDELEETLLEQEAGHSDAFEECTQETLAELLTHGGHVKYDTKTT